MIYPVRPPQVDVKNVPNVVAWPLEEASRCFASECFTASAIMIRKTLEHLCEVQEVKGDNLKHRLEALSSKVTIPKALFDGLQNIRMLGNDAAHWELKHFADVGPKEVALAFEFTGVILHYIYGVEALLNKFEALKAPLKAVEPPR